MRQLEMLQGWSLYLMEEIKKHVDKWANKTSSGPNKYYEAGEFGKVHMYD